MHELQPSICIDININIRWRENAGNRPELNTAQPPYKHTSSLMKNNIDFSRLVSGK